MVSIASPINVLVCDPNLVEHKDELESLIGDQATCHWVTNATSTKALTSLEYATCYIGAKFTAEMAPHAKRLQLVLVGGAGFDGIELTQLPSGCTVANTFNHESSIAEYVIAAAIMMRRGILRQSRALASGDWASSVYDSSISQPPALSGTNVGILGYGHIGKAVWQAFRSFGATGRAIKHTASSGVPDGLEWLGTESDLNQLLDESDVFVICMPLNDSTRGIIGASELVRLGRDAIVVNVGRGPLVDETAFYEALRDGAIGGAAIDVWYRYPDSSGHAMPADKPFWTLPNVLMTPHISGVTSATFTGRVHDIAQNIRNQIEGKPIDRVVYVQS
ncbi:2-hydroxyacid dehydrogenase [Propionimicrobium sp. PCR01-08-3]|uniref:2-hydroxyacid dehydrogenase n=1 Tax=Propionimicrobium sp. PCR01-08-3 TaxID=3052086 RepID=UPI00255C4188|nr:2-hydroxyacid dehydrogenase [Propionimicrobium sp. PCR01-08-3]WIY81740.1 2-hydroxyacid dehydrogenase [Propionimicrobium sp. PCR01-08-3]